MGETMFPPWAPFFAFAEPSAFVWLRSGEARLRRRRTLSLARS
jgi:hypothetical protein